MMDQLKRYVQRKRKRYTDSQRERDDDPFSMPVYPEVGSKWQHAFECPASPESPDATIEVRLYYHETDELGEYWCDAVTKYVEYALLDAWADDGYGVDIAVHPDPVPEDIESASEFSSWYWSLPDDIMAKDCNLILHDYGKFLGQAGGYGGYINVEDFFEDWNRHPDDPIKPLGGGNQSPSEGVAAVLHETGHCLGFGHHDKTVDMYGDSWVSPMSIGYDESKASRYSFRYCAAVRNDTPKVM